MKTLALLILIPGCAFAQLVAHAFENVSTVGTSTTSAVNCTGANFIAVISACFINMGATTEDTPGTTGSAMSHFGDSSSNTYHATTRQPTNGNSVTGQIYYAFNPTVTSTMTWTADPCASGFVGALLAACFSGVQTSSDPKDGSAACTNSNTSAVTTPTFTPSATDLLVSMGLAYDVGVPSVNNSFSIIDSTAGAASDDGANDAYKASVGAGTTVTWTWGSGGGGPAACLIGFKNAGGGGGGQIHHKVSSQ